MEKQSFEPFIRGRRLYADKIANSSETYESLSVQPYAEQGLRIPSGYLAQRLKFTQDTVGEFGMDYGTLEGKMAIVKKDLKYVEDYLKDFLPDHRIVVGGADDASADVYLAKQIINEREVSPREFAIQMENFIEQCGKMFMGSFDPQTREGVIADMQPRDLIFGATKTMKDPKLFYVDLFPTYRVSPQRFIDRVSQLTKNYIGLYNFPKVQELILELSKI